jgi:hypothetical protein
MSRLLAPSIIASPASGSRGVLAFRVTAARGDDLLRPFREGARSDVVNGSKHGRELRRREDESRLVDERGVERPPLRGRRGCARRPPLGGGLLEGGVQLARGDPVEERAALHDRVAARGDRCRGRP